MSDSEDTDYSESESYSTPKSLKSMLEVASSERGVNIIQLSYHDVRRLVDIDDEEVLAKEEADDSLASSFVEAAELLSHEERVGSSEVTVDPIASIALLFDAGEAKAFKARCFLAVNSRSALDICGMLVCSSFTRADGLGTSRFNASYCSEHGIPRLDANTLLIDVVASSGTPNGCGTLLVLAAYLFACRSKSYNRVCTVAITAQGKALFRNGLQWEEHNFRQGSPRTLFWIDTGDMQAQYVSERLRLDDSVKDTCWRPGASARTRDKRYPRCS